MRQSQINRKTKETDITLTFKLDEKGGGDIKTGVGFFDHMLNSMRVHSGLYLDVRCDGDTWIDCHHSVEDVGIVFGEALKEALGDKRGVERFASEFVPLDESLAFCAIDLSGRPHLVFEGEGMRGMVGDFDLQMTEEFFRAVAMSAGITLHIRILYGVNSHHQVEAAFKAFARALKKATRITSDEIVSAKGVL